MLPPCRAAQGLANVVWGLGKLGAKVTHEVRWVEGGSCSCSVENTMQLEGPLPLPGCT